MREIKFRGKRLDWGGWVYGSYAVGSGSSHLILEDRFRHGFDYNGIADSDYYEVDPKTICQYTGMRDRNKEEIYEGDIVHDAYYKRNLEVVWNWDGAGGWWFAEMIDGERNNVQKIDLKYFAVIGTIYDNPELLNAV